jgi:hypothetical protein
MFSVCKLQDAESRRGLPGSVAARVPPCCFGCSFSRAALGSGAPTATDAAAGSAWRQRVAFAPCAREPLVASAS